MDIERKDFPFVMEEKGLDAEARTFKGFAAVMGNLDDGGDIIERGAFKKTIKEMGERVKLYWIHDFNQPIGRVLELAEVPKSKLPSALLERAPSASGGLHVKGYFSQTPKGDEALTLMRDGVLDELSIGYNSVKEEYQDDGPDGRSVRHLVELALMDISPVPLAMNVGAIVTDVKLADLAERIAKEIGLTTEEAYEEFISLWIDKLDPWDDEKPYPNEHACRLKDPDQYDTCRRGSREHDGKKFYVIYCKKTGGKMEEQAYRYPKDTWSADEARAHCKEHEGSFEAARKAAEPPQGALTAGAARAWALKAELELDELRLELLGGK